jgi:dTDP-L-rhamnose 4-epimerase
VDDVVDATVACVSEQVTGVHSLNVGSGRRTSVLEVAEGVRTFFKSTVPVQITGQFRLGDIRHNVADTTRIRALTGYSPKWDFTAGLAEFLQWAQASEAADCGFERSLSELERRGMLGGG